MPNVPRLPLDMSRETRAFRAFVRLLQADETLRRVVATWQVSDGDEGDARPPAEVDLPAVRLMPDLDRVQLRGPNDYYEGVAIVVEFAVAGTNADDRLNLWGALFAALRRDLPVAIGDTPDGGDSAATTVESYFREAGAVVGFWTDPAKLATPPQPGQSLTVQVCRARYFLGSFVPL